MCFSPYEYINNDETESVSLSSTEGLIDYFVQTMGNQGILENNGLRDSTSVLASDFQVGGITYAMYQYMLNYHTTGGIGVMFQTEAGSDIGNLNSTISQGINFGAAAIELPDNFGTLISVTQLQALRPMLKSNAPVN